MEEAQERQLDGEQGDGQQSGCRCLESENLEEGADEFWRSLECTGIDILRDVDVGDVDITGYRAAYQGQNGQIEESVIHGHSTGLTDAEVSATDSEGHSDAQENANTNLLLVI